MTTLRLTVRDDPVVFYTLDADAVRIGEINHHAPHAAILRIHDQAFWLADDVETAQRAAGASIARRLLTHALTPRRYSLRADGGEQVLARAQRRWRWTTRENGLDCEVADASYRIRVQSAFGGRCTLQHGDGRAAGEIVIGSLGRIAHATALPLALPEAVFLLYATHRLFGHDPYASTGGGE